MRLYLIRHGQTPSNVLAALDTAVPGPELTAEGVRQAGAMAAALAGVPIERVYASTMRRAQMTAEPLARARGLTVEVRPGLREVGAGELEMRTDEQSVRHYLSTVIRWAGGEHDLLIPGGDTAAETLGRFDAVVEEVLGLRVGSAALVSHGAMIRLWSASRVRNLTPAFVAEHGLANTGVVSLDGDADGWVASGWEERTVPHVSPAVEDGPGGR
ncbi:histidine phosphatase family protein [Cellulomonas hominis]